MKLCALLPLATLLFACAGCSQSTFQADGSIPDSGPAPDAAIGDFDYFALDPAPNNFSFIAMAVGPNDHVGVAYFMLGDGGIDSGILLPDGGIDTLQGQFEPNYSIQYVEFAGSAVVSGPQTLALWDNNSCPPNGCIINNGTVQLLEGITVAFQNNGQPVVGYMGGPNKNQSPYWFQQNATLNFRATDGQTWTEVSIDRLSVDVPPPASYANGVDITGGIMGLYPTLTVDPDGGMVWFAYRDVHGGQFPKQDWLASDLKIAWGQPSDFLAAAPEQGAASASCYCTSVQTSSAVGPKGCYGVAWDGNGKNAYGGHNHMVMGPNDLPAVAYDQIPGTGGGVDVDGTMVGFYIDQGGAEWFPNFQNSFVQCVSGCQEVAKIGNGGNTGPSLAYDPVDNTGMNGPGLGFGIAVTDLNLSTLFFTTSSDGATWVPQQQVFAYGSGAWYPSLLIDNTFHFPSIAFFFCNQGGGDPISTPSLCGAAQSPAFTPGIYIAEEPGAEWNFVLVDPLGFYMPLIGQLSTGARVVVYDRGDGSLWLAQEKM